MIRYEISTDPACYGSDATDDDASKAADIIAERISALYPEALFEVVTGFAPRAECLPGEEDTLAEIDQTINDNWADWIA
jgi:hypothetical protein